MIAWAFPGARFAVLPATGHLSALEQPHAFGSRLLDFLREVVPRGT